jgi:ABC-type transport system involved in cytochrome bd biosynthesis fused ATPase/permease subunit
MSRMDEPGQESKPAAPVSQVGVGCGVALAVSLVAWLLVARSLFGRMGATAPREIAQRADLLQSLFLVCVIGFDLTVIIGAMTRWRHVVPAAAVWLLVAAVCLYLLFATPAR